MKISGPQIQMSNGRYFEYLRPWAAVYDVRVVAGSLSKLCRYTGHLRNEDDFYSVAQHSELVSRIVASWAPHLAFQGLHHDDPEFVLGDMNRPLKHITGDYMTHERMISPHIHRKFGLPDKLHNDVKFADITALATEKRDLMPADLYGGEWEILDNVEPWPEKIVPLDHIAARKLYLARHYRLRPRG